MATRMAIVQLVREIMEHPIQCIADISQYCTSHYTVGIPYSHIWVSYIADKVGLAMDQAPFTASCDRGANWFRKRKRYKVGQAYGGNYIPCPGDFIYCSVTYEQADATDVGIVVDSDGTLVTFAYWGNGSPKMCTWYCSDANIIGYGIPECDDAILDVMPSLANQGYGVVIVGEEAMLYTGASENTRVIGQLSKGQSVEALEMLPNCWLKVVWGLSPTGYGYLDNAKFEHKVIQDKVPYQQFEGFEKGQLVEFKGGRCYKQPKANSKSNHLEPCVGIIDGISDKADMYHLISRGWVKKSNVDFAPELGYNKRKGEVSVDNACLRIGPGREFTKVQKWPQMVRGNIVDVLGVDTDNDDNGWCLVVIGGVKGYVEDYCIKYIEV